MADATEEIDLSRLSPEQQEALQQFIMVTDQERQKAIPLLRRSEWNVQIAVTKFLDGEQPDPLAEAIAAQNAPQAAATHENIQESLHNTGRTRVLRAHRTEPAPRIIPQRPSTYRPPLPLAIIFAPFKLAYKAVTTIFRTLLYGLTLLPASIRPQAVTNAAAKSSYGRRQLMPRDTAARFKREFDEHYGDNELPWFEGSYSQAYDLAKKELNFLLIVLLAPEHDDTDSFVRDTLLSPEVLNLIKDPEKNIILWGGNMRDSEAYQIYIEYNATKFPWSAVVCLTPKEGSTRMGTVKRLVGPMTGEAYAQGIDSAIAKYAPDLQAVRAERRVQETARTIRTEQDSAYERSLARDRERARLKKEAAAAAAEAEKTALKEAEEKAESEMKRLRWRRWRATSIKPEPEAGNKDVVRLAVKMPEHMGGERVIRRFAKDTTTEELYAWVECYDLVTSERDESELDEKAYEAPEDYEHAYKFQIVSPMPREVFEPSEEAMLGEKIGRGGNLIVEPVYDDE